ncbi:group II intron maturase-specific domain-containing protein [Saccharothrix sp. HUAS TT1]|uniref:group II intron maturase-specific domain-containing protein n=1 Tax=unclassified Saccharothrix TaxID=2593673 RepID=UPI00345BDB9D
MQHARDRIRELTNRRRLRLPVSEVVRDVNDFPRGWTGYFHYEHSAQRFSKIRQYVRMRIALSISKRCRRSRHSETRALRLHALPLINRYRASFRPPSEFRTSRPCSKWVRARAASTMSPILRELVVKFRRARQRPASRANPCSPRQRSPRSRAL